MARVVGPGLRFLGLLAFKPIERQFTHMHETIVASLKALEKERGLRVLFACESGSRAWGFASRDSDWDVRFFFVWPRDHYLRVLLPPDYLHCDLPGELDLTGWDLRKALHHAAKSSASVFEWLRSPVVYYDAGGFAQQMLAVSDPCFQIKPTVHHYLGLARQLWAQAGEGTSLNGKKCLYVLRATLCARWSLTYGTPPPVAFAELLPLVNDAALTAEILEFVRLKQAATEKDALPVSPALREFLATMQSDCLAAAAVLSHPEPDLAPLDHLLLATLDDGVGS
jgi:predicted nucleotidyltransferase